MQNNASAGDTVALSEIIGYRFKNDALLLQAVTHSSFSGEKHSETDYERPEFLGDAVLELLCSEYLYKKYNWSEGELTKHRAEMVCETSLAYVARQNGFGKFLRLNAGEEKTGGRDNDSILCDMVEAILGAIYLDGGLEPARAYATRFIFDKEAELPGDQKDAKSLLQELLQRKGTELPLYTVIAEEGKPHERIFTVELSYGGAVRAQGSGRSKKDAEQNAARAYLHILNS